MGEYEHETVDAIMALNPCDVYSRERVEALVQRLSTETPFQVLSSIPVKDARWFLADALPEPERVQWAYSCASRAQEYAEGVEDTEAADAAYWAADAARAAHWATKAVAYWAAHYAARAAYYAGGEDAQRAEQHLAIRHGLMLLEGM